MKLLINNQKIDLYEAKSFYKRFLGFMFKKKINYALFFKHCNGIHTFFMKEAIDIILTDKNNNILYVYLNFKPWHIIWPKKNVYNTFELPKDSVKNIKINDKIEIIP